MISPVIPERGRQDPFALARGTDAAKAVWAGVAEVQHHRASALADPGACCLADGGVRFVLEHIALVDQVLEDVGDL